MLKPNLNYNINEDSASIRRHFHGGILYGCIRFALDSVAVSSSLLQNVISAGFGYIEEQASMGGGPGLKDWC